MHKPAPGRAPTRNPTAFADLNTVLGHLVDGARERLGDNFVGAYLQGSFGVGDADINSDCDFIIAIGRDLTDAEVEELRALHAAILALPYEPWRHRLEGSYTPIDVLRMPSAEPRDPLGAPRAADWTDPGLGGKRPEVYPYVYLDHGSKTLVRSEHDNTLVVRWCLRERGVVLAGPDPRELVDPVPAEALRAEVRRNMDLCLSLGLEPMDRVFWQSFWVGLFCRMLYTLATGAVASKKASTNWAAATLDPRWRELIRRSQAGRELAVRENPPDPADVAATREFALWAVAHADRAEASRRIIARQLADKRHGHGSNGGPRGGPGGGKSLRPSQFIPADPKAGRTGPSRLAR
jgi:hypothetical protein